MSDTSRASLARAVYVLHLVGLITGGLTAIAGVIIAHINASDAPPPLREHFRFQYRTFWIGLLYLFIAGITTMAFIGGLLMVVITIWWVVRCARGLSALNRDVAPNNVDGWGF
ncbi:MAG: DUF4870 family protein [Alcanivorax sediminis]|uniref:DUF4870 family protein n=1 Tax=Alcanivorax sediminis TaxID=2663008 RepID=UPI003C40E8A6